MEDIKYELPAETAKDYVHVKGAPPLFAHHKFGEIDVRSLTPAKAEQLIKAGIPHIIKKADVPAAAAAPAVDAKAKA